jgi:putative transposase
MSGDGLQSQVRASSGCFEHDKGGRDGAQPFDERLKPGLIVTDAEGVLTRAGIPTGEGWLYLAVMLDLCSRLAVGWAMSDRITDDLSLDALGMALARRRPPPGLLHHSDRGSQYASGDYQRVLAQHGIVGSMSRQGNCWDNAVAESFLATLKVEHVHDAAWATQAAARAELIEYLEVFYNGQRRHSAIGYLSPRAFERQREHEALAT